MIRFVATVAMLLATLAYLMLHPPRELAVGGVHLAACPTTFGPWNGTELSFEDAVIEELSADDLLVRRYRRGDEPVWLTIVYHRKRRYGAHDPRLCYESQGYAIESEGGRRVAGAGGLDVRRFVAARRGERRLVYYWWNAAGLATGDVSAFRRRMAVSGALEGVAWGAFVRVETPIDDATATPASEAVAAARLDDFTARVAAVLPALFAAPEPAS